MRSFCLPGPRPRGCSKARLKAAAASWKRRWGEARPPRDRVRFGVVRQVRQHRRENGIRERGVATDHRQMRLHAQHRGLARVPVEAVRGYRRRHRTDRRPRGARCRGCGGRSARPASAPRHGRSRHRRRAWSPSLSSTFARLFSVGPSSGSAASATPKWCRARAESLVSSAVARARCALRMSGLAASAASASAAARS